MKKSKQGSNYTSKSTEKIQSKTYLHKASSGTLPDVNSTRCWEPHRDVLMLKQDIYTLKPRDTNREIHLNKSKCKSGRDNALHLGWHKDDSSICRFFFKLYFGHLGAAETSYNDKVSVNMTDLSSYLAHVYIW